MPPGPLVARRDLNRRRADTTRIARQHLRRGRFRRPNPAKCDPDGHVTNVSFWLTALKSHRFRAQIPMLQMSLLANGYANTRLWRSHHAVANGPPPRPPMRCSAPTHGQNDDPRTGGESPAEDHAHDCRQHARQRRLPAPHRHHIRRVQQTGPPRTRRRRTRATSSWAWSSCRTATAPPSSRWASTKSALTSCSTASTTPPTRPTPGDHSPANRPNEPPCTARRP